jgi:transposase-like protein
MDKRRSFSDKMKIEVVLEVLKGQRSMTEIASQFEVHSIQV